MKLKIFSNTDNIKKELEEIRTQLKLETAFEIDVLKNNRFGNVILKNPSIILEEETIDFKEVLTNGKELDKNELRILIENIFGLNSSNTSCGTGGCGSCSSSCGN